MAQTWNKELMYRVGQMIGQEALASGYNGWYAPAMNTHRSPFAGRNFEYYSEDPVLGGEIAAAVVRGAATQGCYAYIKHFALNDQETNRTNHIMTWATEQAIRECYLRPFEYCVKADPIEMKYISDDQGTVSTKEMPSCTAVMSSLFQVWAMMTSEHQAQLPVEPMRLVKPAGPSGSEVAGLPMDGISPVL